MATPSSLESDIVKKKRAESNFEHGENSSDSDCIEELNPDSSLKKRKLSQKKSQHAKKIRRTLSECPNEETSLVPFDRSLPAPTRLKSVAKDTHCWLCHKPENVISCHFCVRAYHQECVLTFFAQSQLEKKDWVCPECITLMISECTININARWKNISQADLNEMLSFVLLRVYMITGSSQFQTAVDNQTFRDYYVIVKHPIHLNLLKSRVIKGKYHSVQAFFSDFKWVFHNCTVYNGAASILTNYARNLEKLCAKELNLLKGCPECFRERMPFMIKMINEQNKLSFGKGSLLDKSWVFNCDNQSVNDMWMTKLCSIVHPLVWVRLHSYPVWPGKLISVDEESALVLFFGDYDLNIVPVGSICIHTQSNHKKLISNIANFATRAVTTVPASNSCTKEYQVALEEMNKHLDNIKKRFNYFTIPNKKIEFNIQKGVEYYERMHVKSSRDPDVIVANRLDDAQNREDCASDIVMCEKLELKCDADRFDRMDSNSSVSLPSVCHTAVVKSNRDSFAGPQFVQYFEKGVTSLVNKLKRECMSYLKSPNRDECTEDWQLFKPIMESELFHRSQQTDSISVNNAAVQFSSKQFEKSEELESYAKYLEQCLAASEIELRRQEILSSIRHEEYMMEFSKQQKEMKQIYDTDVRDIVKIVHDKVEERFTRSIRVMKTNEWCAFCGKLARFYCCWNTCYCNQECQTKHWDIHKSACAQVNRVIPPLPLPQQTILRPTPLNIAAANGMQGLITRNGDSVNMNGMNPVEFVPNMFQKQRFQLKR